MAFTSFKNLNEVVTTYKLYYDVANFITIQKQPIRTPSQHLIETLDFNLNETVYDISEASLCESIIYPLLQDVWKAYTKTLFLWSHIGIDAGNELVGVPDYIIAQKSEFGRVLGQPLLATVEAKKDNFSEGWTQCAAQLVAMQTINKEKKNYKTFGIVTNGEQWEFAYLENKNLVKNKTAYSIFDLNTLYSAIDFMFDSCQKQLQIQ